MDRPARPGLRWTPAEQWHVTLRFLPSVDPEALVASLGRLTWPEPVVADAGPAPGALSRQVWALPVSGLEGLAAQVVSLTAGLAEPEERRFKGHLTLARARDPRTLKALARAPLGFSWPVQEAVAFWSELLPDGARHHLIGRWPVGPG